MSETVAAGNTSKFMNETAAVGNVSRAMDEALAVDNVSKSFGGIRALSEVSFRLGVGEILGLIGPNGSGKTTMLNCITGLYHPNGGRIRFLGRDITKTSPHKIFLLGIGRTFQTTRIYSDLTPMENLRLPLFATKVESPEKRIAETLRMLKIPDTGEAARLLNVFEQKKLEIGARLVVNPKLLLLDEPASGLNQEEANEFVRLVKSFQTQGISVLVIEHTMRLILDISDKVVVLSQGEKIAEGPPREIFSNAKVIQGYLGSWRPPS